MRNVKTDLSLHAQGVVDNPVLLLNRLTEILNQSDDSAVAEQDICEALIFIGDDAYQHSIFSGVVGSKRLEELIKLFNDKFTMGRFLRWQVYAQAVACGVTLPAGYDPKDFDPETEYSEE